MVTKDIPNWIKNDLKIVDDIVCILFCFCFQRKIVYMPNNLMHENNWNQRIDIINQLTKKIIRKL